MHPSGVRWFLYIPPRVLHKMLHLGLPSLQPFGLRTPEACKNISPGYASFAYPGWKFPRDERTPEAVRGLNRLVECVPNFSEGRRPEVVEAIIAAVTSVPNIYLLDREMDADHNRAVLTIV